MSCSNVHEYDMKDYDIIYELTTRLLGVGRVESTDSFHWGMSC